MSKYNDLTIEQLRLSLDFMERNYSMVMEQEFYGLAGALKVKIDDLMAELRARTKQVPAEELITADMAAMLK